MRDPERLEVFRLARSFAVDVYRLTSVLPDPERYNIQGQLRRAVVSVVANIAEGCGRSGRGEYEHFLNIALGSAVETGALLDVAVDLGLITPEQAQPCRTSNKHLVRSLHKLHTAVRQMRP